MSNKRCNIYISCNGQDTIYETIAHSIICNLLEGQNILSSWQHGFRPGKSTVTASGLFLYTIIDSIDGCTS